MLENPANAAKYEHKISTFAGLAETRSELAAIDEKFDVYSLQNIDKELSIIENYTDPTPPTPSPTPTPEPEPKPEPEPQPQPTPTPTPEPVEIKLTIDKEYTLKSIDKSVKVTYDDAKEYTLTTDNGSETIAKGDFEGKTISSSDVLNFTMDATGITRLDRLIDFSGNTGDTTIKLTNANNIDLLEIKGGSGQNIISLDASKKIGSVTIEGNVSNDKISISSTETGRVSLNATKIDAGDGDDEIDVSVNSLNTTSIKGGKGSDTIEVSGSRTTAALKFDYSNDKDFTEGDIDTINGFGIKDRFILPSGYSFLKYDENNNNVIIKENSDGTEYTIATLVGFQGSVEQSNFITS